MFQFARKFNPFEPLNRYFLICGEKLTILNILFFMLFLFSFTVALIIVGTPRRAKEIEIQLINAKILTEDDTIFLISGRGFCSCLSPIL